MKAILSRHTSLDDLPKNQRSQPKLLLEFLKRTQVRRVSTFEIDAGVMRAFKVIEEAGELTCVDAGYPWHKFTLKGDSTK